MSVNLIIQLTGAPSAGTADERPWTRAATQIALWRRCTSSRRELLNFNDLEPRDIGFTRSAEIIEPPKPFWRPRISWSPLSHTSIRESSA